MAVKNILIPCLGHNCSYLMGFRSQGKKQAPKQDREMYNILQLLTQFFLPRNENRVNDFHICYALLACLISFFSRS